MKFCFFVPWGINLSLFRSVFSDSISDLSLWWNVLDRLPGSVPNHTGARRLPETPGASFLLVVFFKILSQVLFSAPLLKNRKIETVKKYLLEPTLMSETHWLLAERVKKPIIYRSNTKEWNDSERSHNHPCFLYTGTVLSRRRSLGA